MNGRIVSLLFVVMACEPDEFESPSVVQSLRVLAARADTPYAEPGATVNLEVLAIDGRKSKPEPMHVYFLPDVCVNPEGDAYYACFSKFRDTFSPDVDLSPWLYSGATHSFEVPADAVESHGGQLGNERYGVLFTFLLACAGEPRYVPPRAGAAIDSVPFGCFDARGERLGPEDFVFAFSVVYAFADRVNQNPVIEGVTIGGDPVDPNAGIRVERCERSDTDDCPSKKIDVVVPPSSQEPDPSNLDSDGNVLKEQVFVQYYLTGGELEHDTVVIFDPREGRLSDTGSAFRAPRTRGAYRFWAVLRDNRGGVAWLEMPLHVD